MSSRGAFQTTIVKTGACLFLALCQTAVVSPAPAIAEDPERFLEVLRDSDRSSKSIDVKSRWLSPSESTDLYPILYEATYTHKGEFMALNLSFQELLTGEKPSKRSFPVPFLPSLVFEESHIYAADMAGSTMVHSMERRKTLEELAEKVPSPEGATNVTTHVYNPGDQDVAYRIFIAKWALGRGYSDHLTSISEIKHENGFLLVSGSGFWLPHLTGAWKLKLEKEPSLLVREATFWFNETSAPAFHVETEGTLLAGNPPSNKLYARTCYYTSIQNNNAKFEIENLQVSEKLNQIFFDSIREKFDETLPDGSLLVDGRGQEDVYTPIRHNTRDGRASLTKRPGVSLPRIVLIVNLGVLGLALVLRYVYVRRKVKRTAAS